MAVKIEFETSNAVFEADGYNEVVLILRRIADTCERSGLGSAGGTIRDSNGNRIGDWVATIDADETNA